MQELIVIAIVSAAVVYGVMVLVRKTSSFSVKKKCGKGCGCDG